ncbi:hypothetical protein DSC45_30595 [Streptomyces sp. YIM 130001]|uniref:DUF485 domain-containing protein n=1 Tax=Streptomyces sp. YIM 130001 TaxID=2259644 RepID=UPI000ED18511|nr:DUF485 domain-containing protein [Streptomyces sp. YIM 130001]RII09430.1 hypothetical protein DSC45_30595 [Streptomyces sp. YIM 130001]
MDQHDSRETGHGVRVGDPGDHRDPWDDASASGWGELDSGFDGAGVPAATKALPTTTAAPANAPWAAATPPGPRTESATAAASAGDIYLEVQRSAAFQEVRGSYRRFVVPAVIAFFTWYLAYVVAATTVPDFMARPVAGAVNVAMLAGLGQFLTTFLLTWAYARHARLRRDRAALELRWNTQELTRGIDR